MTEAAISVANAGEPGLPVVRPAGAARKVVEVLDEVGAARRKADAVIERWGEMLRSEAAEISDGRRTKTVSKF